MFLSTSIYYKINSTLFPVFVVNVRFSVVSEFWLAKSGTINYNNSILLSAIICHILFDIAAALTRYTFHLVNVFDREYKIYCIKEYPCLHCI